MDVLFTERLFRILSWTLMHSLWLGLVISMFAGVVMAISVKRTPVLRYNLLTALFFLFISGVVIIFITQFSVPDRPEEGVFYFQLVPMFSWFFKLIDVAAVYIVFVWLFVIGYKAFEIRSDLRQVYMLRNNGCKPITPATNLMFRSLCLKMNVYKQVNMMESCLIRVPVVIGHLKPVVLVPAGLLTTLPTDELEAILLHELAHIRRNDYLINLVQRITEAIFFFNPALLWLSAQMRIEREHCCDDRAISITGNKEQFVRALISCKEFVTAPQPYAPGFFSTRSLLLARVSRIVYNRNQTVSDRAKFVLAAGIMVSVYLICSTPGILPHPQDSLPSVQVNSLLNNPVTGFHSDGITASAQRVREINYGYDQKTSSL
ncbi:MAG: M56 family metallopeptidase, partial [Chitinophagaceae bacterium]